MGRKRVGADWPRRPSLQAESVRDLGFRLGLRWAAGAATRERSEERSAHPFSIESQRGQVAEEVTFTAPIPPFPIRRSSQCPFTSLFPPRTPQVACPRSLPISQFTSPFSASFY